MSTKNSLYTALIAAALLMATSCQEDLLDTPPNDRLSSEIFWKSEADAKLAVNAAYPTCLEGGVNVNGVANSASMLFQWDAFTDIGHINLFYSADALVEKNTFDASSSIIANQWSTLYTGVTNTNFILDNIGKVPVVNQAVINQYTGEAKVLRAYQYIKLAALFGDVPLITKVMTIEEGRQVTRTPVAGVWDFVDKELGEAADLLPAKYAAAESGRITKGAALALQARANLYAGRYQNAADAAKKVMDMNIYGIYPQYAQLFSYAAENNTEVILDRQFLKDVLSNNIFGSMAPYGQLGTNIANSFVPTKALAVMYPMSNGKLIAEAGSGFNPLLPYNNRDPRLRFTFYVPGDILPNGKVFNSVPNSGTADAAGSTFFASSTGFAMRKYVNAQDAANPTNNGINVILIRYAEVLLTYAEAKIELNQIDQSVIDAINKVRQRADVNLPALTLALTRDQLIEAVRRERTTELAFEGFRMFDIRRWKIAETVIPGDVSGIDYVEGGVSKTVVIPSFTKTFNPARDYLWPIPSNERILSPDLGQNSIW